MTETDVYNLSGKSIFDSIKGNVPEGCREVCDVFEDLLYVWNYKESHLLVINWRSAQSTNTADAKHQVCFKKKLTCLNTNFISS